MEVFVFSDVVATMVGVRVGESVTAGVPVRVAVRVLVAVAVLAGGEVGVTVVVGSPIPVMFSVKSVNRAGSLTTWPSTSTISVSRVIGYGGMNSQCMMNVPGAHEHNPICATRKFPPHPVVQWFIPPEA